MKTLSNWLAMSGCMMISIGVVGSCIAIGAKIVRVGWGC